jgi:catechol 2,3-dioxygenase-like lactoylglutathione lyase family enzyme
MVEFATPATSGVDHVGLSVRDLESTRRFFCDCLGWRVVGERLEYPAALSRTANRLSPYGGSRRRTERSRSTGAPTSAFIT